MVFVDPKIAKTVAHMPETRAAVRAERDRVAHIAEGLFAAHDHPGRHKITTQDEIHEVAFGSLDAFFSIEGPAPLSVEFGHWTPGHKRFVEGLHVFSRAIGEASA